LNLDDLKQYKKIDALNAAADIEGLPGQLASAWEQNARRVLEVLAAGGPGALSVGAVARRVGLELEGVGFPGHFLVKYVGAEEEIIIDPFHQGEVRFTEELEEMLDGLYRGKLALRPEFLSPLSKKQILRRMLNNLKAIYLRQGDLLKDLSVVERLLILEPNSVSEIRDRGLLYVKLECFPQALQDLEAYLRLSAHADDAPEVRDQVVSLRKLVTLIH